MVPTDLATILPEPADARHPPLAKRLRGHTLREQHGDALLGRLNAFSERFFK